MAETYSEVYYHIVWSTKGREPMITPKVEEVLHNFLRHKCTELEAWVYALNGMEDHVHLAVSIPLRLSVSDFMQHIKGSSSYFINHVPVQGAKLHWQQGFGVMTFAKRELPTVVGYINRQKERHQSGDLFPKLERLGGDRIRVPAGSPLE